MTFWTEPQMTSIHKMLNPRSIAIVGATPRMQYGGRFRRAAPHGTDRIRGYCITPRYAEIMGKESIPAVAHVGKAPTAVAALVSCDRVLDVLPASHPTGAG